MVKNFLFAITTAIFVLLISATGVSASEGVINLHGINESDVECFAMSTIINRSNSYNILIQCQNLIYPVENGAAFYILWATPYAVEAGKEIKPIHLGDLEFGRKSFKTKNAFSDLYVTREIGKSPKQSSNDRVLQGIVEPINFSNTQPTPTIAPEPTTKPSPKITPEKTPKVTPAVQSQGGGLISTIISIITTVVVIIIIVVIIIFIIYKIRNRNN